MGQQQQQQPPQQPQQQQPPTCLGTPSSSRNRRRCRAEEAAWLDAKHDNESLVRGLREQGRDAFRAHLDVEYHPRGVAEARAASDAVFGEPWWAGWGEGGWGWGGGGAWSEQRTARRGGCGSGAHLGCASARGPLLDLDGASARRLRRCLAHQSRIDLAQALLRELAYVLDDDCATRRYKDWYNARPRSSGMSKNGYLYLPAAARFLAAGAEADGAAPESATRCGVGEEMLMEEATHAKRGRRAGRDRR